MGADRLTDEQLAELARVAEDASALNRAWLTEIYLEDHLCEAEARHIAAAHPGTVAALVEEVRELRAAIATQAAEVQLRLRQMVELAEQRDAAVADVEQLEEDIDEHLPEYVVGRDDGEEDAANHRERIEYAGVELTRLARRAARLSELLLEAGYALADVETPAAVGCRSRIKEALGV